MQRARGTWRCGEVQMAQEARAAYSVVLLRGTHDALTSSVGKLRDHRSGGKRRQPWLAGRSDRWAAAGSAGTSVATTRNIMTPPGVLAAESRRVQASTSAPSQPRLGSEPPRARHPPGAAPSERARLLVGSGAQAHGLLRASARAFCPASCTARRGCEPPNDGGQLAEHRGEAQRAAPCRASAGWPGWPAGSRPGGGMHGLPMHMHAHMHMHVGLTSLPSVLVCQPTYASAVDARSGRRVPPPLR